jgi:3-oxoadipate enol-lactonase
MAKVLTSAGDALGFAEAGGGARTAIVFLHGVGSDKSVWRPQLAHFGQERRSIAFDYPGYGDSDPAPQGATRDDYARSIWSALDRLGVERAHLCGLSLGGVVAIAMHHAAPERCVSLILADTFAVHPEGEAIYERSVAAAESGSLRPMAETRVDFLLAKPADPAVRDEVVETMAGIDPSAYRIGAQAVWLADQRERVRAIRVPTLILCGDDDRPTPPELSRALQAMIAGSRLEMIAHAGHLTNFEQPDVFNRFVDAFLSEAEA